jgi:cytochrome c553
MQRRPVALFVACFLGLLARTVSAQPPAEDALGEAALLASTCSGCHGKEPDSAIASLHGRSAAEIADAFLSYKNDADGPSAMHRMAWGYTDEQIRRIADYLADQ